MVNPDDEIKENLLLSSQRQREEEEAAAAAEQTEQDAADGAVATTTRTTTSTNSTSTADNMEAAANVSTTTTTNDNNNEEDENSMVKQAVANSTSSSSASSATVNNNGLQEYYDADADADDADLKEALVVSSGTRNVPVGAQSIIPSSSTTTPSTTTTRTVVSRVGGGGVDDDDIVHIDDSSASLAVSNTAAADDEGQRQPPLLQSSGTTAPSPPLQEAAPLAGTSTGTGTGTGTGPSADGDDDDDDYDTPVPLTRLETMVTARLIDGDGTEENDVEAANTTTTTTTMNGNNNTNTNNNGNNNDETITTENVIASDLVIQATTDSVWSKLSDSRVQILLVIMICVLIGLVFAMLYATGTFDTTSSDVISAAGAGGGDDNTTINLGGDDLDSNGGPVVPPSSDDTTTNTTNTPNDGGGGGGGGMMTDGPTTSPTSSSSSSATSSSSSSSNTSTTKFQTCGTMTKKQIDYIGSLNITKSGKTCQSWSAQFPHLHSSTMENYPNANLIENYCRNPDGEPGVWCYTTDPETRWELCALPDCGYCGTTLDDAINGCDYTCTSNEECPTTEQTCYLPNTNTTTEITTVCGLQDVITSPPAIGDGGGTGEDVPILLHEFCGTRGQLKQSDYRGTINVTSLGDTCQAWTAQFPHQHSRIAENYPNAGLGDHNYCRNPDGELASWCYTLNATLRWSFCDVPACGYCGIDKATTERACGATCQDDDDCTIDGHVCVFGTLCGLEIGGPGAPPAQYDCGSISLFQIDYRGTVNVTATGVGCQGWGVQEPHEHTRYPELYPLSGLKDNNYCRNPDGEERAWCYTTDPDQRWQYCDIPACEESNRP